MSSGYWECNLQTWQWNKAISSDAIKFRNEQGGFQRIKELNEIPEREKNLQKFKDQGSSENKCAAFGVISM